jgi:hypothetical protein
VMAVPGLDPTAVAVVRALERAEGPVAQVLHHVFCRDARRVEVRADFRRRARMVVIVVELLEKTPGVSRIQNVRRVRCLIYIHTVG